MGKNIKHYSRRRMMRRRRMKSFFKFLIMLIVVAAIIFGALFALTKLPEDSILSRIPGLSTPAPTATPAPTPTVVPTEAPTAEPTAEPTAKPTPTPTVEPTEAPTPTPEPTPRAVVFRVTGDIMVSEGMLGYAAEAGGEGAYDFDPQFALIAEELANADYTMGNLETTIGMYKDRPYSGYPQFNTPEIILETLKEAGYDFFTLANNHMLDRWFDGMKNTVSHVEAAGLEHSGAYVSQEARDAAKVVEINGVKFGFLSYTDSTNGMEESADEAVKIYGVPYLRESDFEADVKKLRDAGAEIVIAFPHWGVEYAREADGTQKLFAKALANAGVDVILGSHPHVLQEISWITAEDGRKVLTAYSLGNFISTQDHHGYTDTGMILEFSVKETEDGSLQIGDVGYVPTYCWKHDNTLQVVNAAAHLEQKPEGMSDSAYSRLKESYEQTRELIHESIPVLKK